MFAYVTLTPPLPCEGTRRGFFIPWKPQMTPTELNELVMTLQSTTPLSRLTHDEAHVVMVKLSELGFVAPAASVPAVK